MYHWGAITLLVSLIGAASAQQASTEKFDQKQVFKLLESHKTLFGIENPELLKDMGEESLSGYERPLRKVTYSNTKEISVDTSTGKILRYRFQKIESVPTGLTKDDAIPEGQAMDTAKSFLDELGISLDDLKYTFGYHDPMHLEMNDLHGASWMLHGKLEPSGVPFAFGMVTINVSAYSGEVRMFVHFPVIMPESVRQVFSQEECELIARDFVKDNFALAAVQYVFDSRLATMQRNGHWHEPQSYERLGIGRLCWVITVRRKAEDIHPVCSVYVDCETGEIIGGH